MKLIDADTLAKYAWSNPDIEVDGEPYISPFTVQNFAMDHPITVDLPNEPLTLEHLRASPHGKIKDSTLQSICNRANEIACRPPEGEA